MASSAAKSSARIMRISEAKCNEWVSNPLINPITGAAIAENGPTYNAIKERCDQRYMIRLPGVNYGIVRSTAESDSNSASASTSVAPSVPLTEEQTQQLALIQEEFKRWNAFLYANTFRVGNWFDGIAANYMIMARKATRLGIPRVEILKMSRVPKRPGQKVNKSDKWGKWRESLIEMSLDVEVAGQESPEYTAFRNILTTTGGDIRAAILYGIGHALELNSMYDEYQIFMPIPFTLSLPQFKAIYNEVVAENNDYEVEIPDTEGVYKLVHATFNLTDLQKYNAVLYVLREQYDDDVNMEEFMKGRHFSEKSDERLFINSLYFKRVELRKRAIEDLLPDVLLTSPLPSDEKMADLDTFLTELNDNRPTQQDREFIVKYSRIFYDIKAHLIPDIREELSHLVNRENADIAYSESDGPASLSSDTGRSRKYSSSYHRHSALSHEKPRHVALPPLPENDKTRQQLLRDLKASCRTMGDLIGTSFDKYSKRDLQLIVKLSVGTGKDNCYSIRDIYKLWVDAVKYNKPLRDPVTQMVVPDEKLEEILRKIKYISYDAPDPRTLTVRPSTKFKLRINDETLGDIHFNYLKAIREFGSHSVVIADLYYLPSELEPADFRGTGRRGTVTQEISSAVLMANISDLFEKGGLLTSNVPPYGIPRILNKPMRWWTVLSGPTDRLIKGVSRIKFYEVYNEILEGLGKPRIRIPHYRARQGSKSSSDEYR